MYIPVISAIILVMLASACKPGAGNSTATREDTPQSSPDSLNPTFTYEIIGAPEGTFGYNILADGKVIINQTSIPGMQGIKGFSNEQDAMKVAGLVMGKLMNHEMPPTVTEDELKGLGVGE